MNSDILNALQEVQRQWEMSDGQLAAVCHFSAEKWAQPSEREKLSLSELAPAQAWIAIHRKLQLLFQEKKDPKETQLKWLSTPHPDFGNHRPIEIAASSPENLAWLAYYLETSVEHLRATSELPH